MIFFAKNEIKRIVKFKIISIFKIKNSFHSPLPACGERVRVRGFKKNLKVKSRN